MSVLSMESVSKSFRRGGSVTTAVDGVSLEVAKGETVGLIGESGSGKSTLGRLALGLLTPDSGVVSFAGRDITQLDPAALRRLRKDMQAVFQEPYESLNPRMRVEDIACEPLDIHRTDLSRSGRRALAHAALDRVGVPTGLRRRRPRELSGGEQQRVGIARAIVTEPQLLVLDEPTSSLDLSMRAGILHLLTELQRELGLGYLFISHDMSTVEYLSARVIVMYRGRLVEQGPVDVVLDRPAHPYTRILMDARLTTDLGAGGSGWSPSSRPRPDGSCCPFYSRCPIAADDCRTLVPAMEVAPGHLAACLHPDLVSEKAAGLDPAPIVGRNRGRSLSA